LEQKSAKNTKKEKSPGVIPRLLNAKGFFASFATFC